MTLVIDIRVKVDCIILCVSMVIVTTRHIEGEKPGQI